MANVGAIDNFHFIRSSEHNLNVQVKIGTLEGQITKPTHIELLTDPYLYFTGSYQDRVPDLYVSCQLYYNDTPMATPIKTAYKTFTRRWNWNEWLTLPLKYSELPLETVLAFTICDLYNSEKIMFIGGTSIKLFSKKALVRQGMYDLKVWPKKEGDGRWNNNSTPGKLKSKDDEMSRLAKLTKKHSNGQIPKIDWLDRLTFREIELINERQKRESNMLFLNVEFPRFHINDIPYAVAYFEPGADEVLNLEAEGDLCTLYDPELGMDNLVEEKFYRLARSLKTGLTDRDLKPNAAVRDRLMTLVLYPPTTTLTSEDKDLIWRFRFYLSSQKKALTKFVRSVQWKIEEEVKQALDLINKWAPMDSEDALELLSTSFTHPDIRRYAVARLNETDDEDLILYILQLVQALKYENFQEIQSQFEMESLMTLSMASSNLTTNQNAGLGGGGVNSTMGKMMSHYEAIPEQNANATASNLPCDRSSQMDLASFLIHRACKNAKLANYFYWYLRVECEDEQRNAPQDAYIYNMYRTVIARFIRMLAKGCRQWQLLRSSFVAQEQFIDKLVQVVQTVARETGNRFRKIEKLQSLLKERDHHGRTLVSFDPIPFPLDPDVIVWGIDVESATLFKSALMPCRLTMKTTTSTNYIAIFKNGDDLRQDQLVLQIFQLMDKLLKRENLDMKLTPYKVLATANKHGFVQYIESTTVLEILSTEGSIVNYLKKLSPPSSSSSYDVNNPTAAASSSSLPANIHPEILDNYIRSCAGYCVITYLLGVGDRHFDNLLITKTGKLFHIDFGYILGRDPKILPPPMKLTKEMIEPMGGVTGEKFTEFKQLCYTTFLHLRRSSSLILNLFSLMIDANVPDIALEPDKTVKKVLDRFQLELSDEQAVQVMQNLIEFSLNATAAVIIEQMHKFTQVCCLAG
ncbi:hypothetical protein HELRODRAFT_113006 [Helobdella robusta]|uniref:Phosphatidylinositol 3-kinase catalytic subunit type 3 n=1 Tax=Helobdella robusta TaxID=6412 RepID=T1EFP5_HELRO|nr:hypothetical protein HELRODRAFT_113006 [Helobdella robusta]ESO00877.1 hypothetical protein HELRODRAFT_113006 [Helobdella robusta]